VALPTVLIATTSSEAGPSRLFATHGGPTLDVSDDGGAHWQRLIDRGGATVAQGCALDTAQEWLWFVAEGRLDRVSAYGLRVSGALPRQWSIQNLPEWDANGAYVAVADPHSEHGIYVGGEGRLGYLTPSPEGAAQLETRWNAGGLPQDVYPYLVALWADPSRAGHVLMGGGVQGAGPATLLKSEDYGVTARAIALEGNPYGTVRAVALAPDESTLLVLVDSTVYVLPR
jgi:hypothetical protein